jgi:hypothetical protein
LGVQTGPPPVPLLEELEVLLVAAPPVPLLEELEVLLVAAPPVPLLEELAPPVPVDVVPPSQTQGA